MKLQIKQYEYDKREVGSKEIQLPTETSYYFETGIRRSIKIVPSFITKKEKKELYQLTVVCLYQSSECKAEKFNIRVKDIEDIYYSDDHKHNKFIYALIEGWFDQRTKEQFDEDLNNFISDLKSI